MNLQKNRALFGFTKLVALLGLFILFVGSPDIAHADTCTVTTNADSGAGSLRDKIADASCTTIVFDGDYTILLESELVIDKNLNIDGTGHTVTLSGQDIVRVLNIQAGTVVRLNLLTIRNGTAYTAVGKWNSYSGGGIFNAGALTVTFCTFTENHASDYGGAIDSEDGTLSVADSTFTNNQAYYGGAIIGAIISDEGTLSVAGSEFSGNLAYYGGAIWVNETTAITDSTFTENYASGRGGAIELYLGALTISHSTFMENYASDYGGAIDSDNGTLSVADSTFTGNAAVFEGGAINSLWSTLSVADSEFLGNGADYGGAIWMDYKSTITDSTFTENSANDYGGGIRNWGELTIVNSTLTKNSADEDGGGIANAQDGVLTIVNSTFSANTATGSGGNLYDGGGSTTFRNSIVANSGSDNCYIEAVSNTGVTDNLRDRAVPDKLEHNLSTGDSTPRQKNPDNNLLKNFNNDIAPRATAPREPVRVSGITDGGNNIDSGATCGFSAENGSLSNTDPLLDVLGDYGGSTQTLPLLSNSPAIDAGDNSVCADTDTVNNLDQRGEARDDLRCDIGAFEYKGTKGEPVQVEFNTNDTSRSFGPARAAITVTNGAPITLTVTFTETAISNPAPPKDALPLDWNVESSKTGFSLLVTLCYSPTVLTPGVDESKLHIYHYNDTKWEDLGGALDTTTHAPYHCLTATTPLTSLSPLALAPVEPTATDVNGVKAFVNKKGYAVIRWKTLSEARIAGFNIYRKGGKNDWQQVNATFKQAKHAGDAMGDKYKFTDRKVNAGKSYRYKVEIVYLDGHTEFTKLVKVKIP